MAEVLEPTIPVKTGNMQEDLFAEIAHNMELKKTAEKKNIDTPPSDIPPVVDTPPDTDPPLAVDKKPESDPDKKEDTPPADVKPTEISDADLIKELGFEQKKPKETIVPEKNNEELETYKAKASELDAILANKEIKTLWDSAKNGESVFEVVKKAYGEDYSKLSAKELFELDLNTHGLSDEDKEIEREKFNGMLVSQQKDLGNKIKQGLDANRNARLEQHNSTMVELQARLQANAQKAMQRVNELKENKTFMNMEITPERWNEIYDYVDKNIVHDSKLEFDVDKTYKHAIFDLFAQELIVANVRKATTKVKVEVLDTINRPSTGAVSSHTAPPVTDGEAIRKKDVDSFLEKQKEPFKN